MERLKNWAQHGAALGIVLWAFACSGGGNTPQTTTGGNAGAGGTNQGSSSSSSEASSSVASSSVAVGVGGFGGGPMAFVCDPPAEPGSLYENSAVSYDINDIDPVSMCKYRGKVLLVVNTAAAWGYTPQYAGLQVLEEKLSGPDFEVLGFLSNDFGNQGGSSGQIDTCVDSYMLTFKQFAIRHVYDVDGAGPEEPQPVWKWLLSQPDPGPVVGLAPTWNFHKYLISRDGKVVKHWASPTYPGDDPNNPNDSFDTSEIVQAIKAEIAK